MFGADARTVEGIGLLGGESQDLLHTWRIGNIADRFLIRPDPDLLLDLHPHDLEVNTHYPKHVDRHALAELDEPQEQVFRSHEIVVEAIGFLARKCKCLRRVWCEFSHFFFTHVLPFMSCSRIQLFCPLFCKGFSMFCMRYYHDGLFLSSS